VRRLNERGNKLVISADGSRSSHAAMLDDMGRAEHLFRLAHALNPRCIVCNANLGDLFLRLDRNGEAEVVLRQQIRSVPRDADAHYGLGVALRSQDREAEAVGAYQGALALDPDDFQCTVSLAASHGAIGEYAEEQRHYTAALRLQPNDVKSLLNIGISYTSVDDMDAAEAAFVQAETVAPTDGRPPLQLGRLLAKQNRPEEAIQSFYRAAANDVELFDEVKGGIGTAKAQQGRLAEASMHFASAHRMDPKNERLAAAVAQMPAQAERLELLQSTLANAVDSLCGTPCQDVVDSASLAVCSITFADGCGDVPPPAGFAPDTPVADLCAHACALTRLPSQA